MVFGFGKKKVAEIPPIPAQKQREISLQDISPLIKEFEVPRASRVVQQAKLLRKEIESNQKIIYELILQLESDDLKLDDVDKNLKTIGKRGKDAVVSTIKKETKARLAEVERYEDVIELSSEVNQILKRMGDILGLHTRVMHIFARKYADKLKEEISKLASNRNSLLHIISEQEKFRSEANSILKTIEDIRALKENRVQKSRRVNEVISAKTDAVKSAAMLEQEIAGMKSRPEYGQFLELKKKVGDIDHEKDEIRGKIGAQFLKISRPLNKYSYVSSFDKPMKKLMEELIADPYQALSAENKSQIVEILQAVTKSVVAGNVSVKDSDRSAELIEETIERLDEFLAIKASYAKKASDLESMLGIFDSKKLGEKQTDLEKTRLNLADLEATHEKLEREINENHAQIESLRQELEKRVTKLSDDQIVAKIQS